MDYETRFYLIALFDFYAPLLTDKQKQYFQDYYFADNSLSEIADAHQVSRAAVQEAIKKINCDLEYYEAKLSLYSNSQQRKQLYDQISNNEIKNKLIELEEKGSKNEK